MCTISYTVTRAFGNLTTPLPYAHATLSTNPQILMHIRLCPYEPIQIIYPSYADPLTDDVHDLLQLLANRYITVPSIFKLVRMHAHKRPHMSARTRNAYTCVCLHPMHECRRAYLFSCTPIQPHIIAPADLSATHLSSEVRARLTCSAFAVSSMYRCASPD